MNIIGIGFLFIIAVIFLKYKPAYKVSFLGEEIGYIEDKQKIEQVIEQFVNTTEGNIAFVELDEVPEFQFEFVNRTEKMQEEKLLAEIKGKAWLVHLMSNKEVAVESE